MNRVRAQRMALAAAFVLTVSATALGADARRDDVGFEICAVCHDRVQALQAAIHEIEFGSSAADRLALLQKALSSAWELEETVQAELAKLEEALTALGDDAQLAHVDLQNILQKQQQTLQMMSNISKMLYDTAMSIIRKIGG